MNGSVLLVPLLGLVALGAGCRQGTQPVPPVEGVPSAAAPSASMPEPVCEARLGDNIPELAGGDWLVRLPAGFALTSESDDSWTARPEGCTSPIVGISIRREQLGPRGAKRDAISYLEEEEARLASAHGPLERVSPPQESPGLLVVRVRPRGQAGDAEFLVSVSWQIEQALILRYHLAGEHDDIIDNVLWDSARSAVYTFGKSSVSGAQG